ncbi:hypothetical protein ACIRU3_30845 [Streptomyces sp. NPDC101151]|uniref:hypothetical protein n=1 Tax=Streptomyces sp. NPDC101151 TaxID=3366115 RepID=UPI00380EA39E
MGQGAWKAGRPPRDGLDRGGCVVEDDRQAEGEVVVDRFVAPPVAGLLARRDEETRAKSPEAKNSASADRADQRR